MAGRDSYEHEVTPIQSSGAKSRFADDMILAKQFNFRSAKIRDVLSAKWQKLGLARSFNIAGDHRGQTHSDRDLSRSPPQLGRQQQHQHLHGNEIYLCVFICSSFTVVSFSGRAGARARIRNLTEVG